MRAVERIVAEHNGFLGLVKQSYRRETQLEFIGELVVVGGGELVRAAREILSAALYGNGRAIVKECELSVRRVPGDDELAEI